MSAYIVSKRHIDAIVTLITDGPSGVHRGRWDVKRSIEYAFGYVLDCQDGRDRLGRELWSENLKSVAYRYPEDTPSERPGPVSTNVDIDVELYFHATGRALTVVEALMALNGYEYQCCEHDAWRESRARDVIERLRHSLVSVLPGYNDAKTWSIS